MAPQQIPHDPVLADLTRESLAASTVRVLSRGGWANADVSLVRTASAHRLDDSPPELIVVKDFGPRAAWVRATLARWLVRRETAAYRRLDSHPAVPRLLGRIDALAFALEYRPGRALSREIAQHVPGRFLPALEAAVDRMHAAGVVHLDLKHRGNVLLGERGEPVLLDFASSISFTPGSWLFRWYRPSLQRYDAAALRKWRERLSPWARPSRRRASRRLRRRLRQQWLRLARRLRPVPSGRDVR